VLAVHHSLAAPRVQYKRWQYIGPYASEEDAATAYE
jgi:hypothetical protein